MLKRFAINEGKVVETTETDCQICVYINPDENENRYLVDTLKIDEHTLHSSLDPNELTRMEFEPDHTVLILKRPKRYNSKDNFLFKIESAGLFVFSNKLVIVISEDIPIFENRYFNKIFSIQDIILKLIYQWTFHFIGHLKVISMCSDELEREINTSISNKQLISMFTLEKSLVFYLEAISSNGRMIDKIKSNANKFALSTLNLEYLDDIAIENTQCFEMAEIYSQVLSSLMDARASIISNNLNIMMKNLNALVIAVAVPSFFAGVGGMSEFSSIIGLKNLKFGYFVFVLIMFLLGAGTFFIIKKVEKIWRDS